MRTGTALPALFLLALAAGPASGRGGGGCLESGTAVLTPAGEVPIERLRPGDAVRAVTADGLRPATVQGVFEVQPEYYLELSFPGGCLRVTDGHPIGVGAGEFRVAGALGPGRRISRLDGGKIAGASLQSVRRVKALRPAYHLLVSPGGTYVANGVVVHNKGCFLPDTPILRADGAATAIRDVKSGDELLAFRTDGAVVTAKVLDVLTAEVDEYFVVTTRRAVLCVTREHPFYVGDGTFRALGAIKVGDTIYAYDGRGLAAQRIVAMERVAVRTTVYNLRTDEPNTFFANALAVHNKGGGGGGGGGGGFHGGHSSGGKGSGDPVVAIIALAVIVAIIVIVSAARRGSREDEDLDYVYGQSAVAGKATQTAKLLDFIARTDGDFAPESLRSTAEAAFRKLQECWQGRHYDPMQPLMMPDLYAQHCRQIQGMIRDHEVDIIANLNVERVEIVNVRYTHENDHREFTALVTASARDYYVDDRSREFLRGDSTAARFQEFWTFQRQGKAWLLREIEQTRESDKLREENFFEPFTDRGLGEVYGDAAGQTGRTGPWLEKSTATKAVKIERMLNFLAATDKLWNRRQMLDCARQVFVKVHLAQEAGDVSAVPSDDLFPDVAEHLKAEIAQRRAAGMSVEYRNLCVRKAELILVRNFTEQTQDEWTVRISAHAQRVVRRGANVSQDEYVRPFEEYWTFGRLDGRWKLKEVLPSSRAGKALAAENLDQDSTPDQVQWYYRQKRAV